MTFGTMLRAAMAAVLAPAICCAALDLDTLLASLARPAPAATSFVEVRFSNLLDRPLVTQGRLEYLGPNHLARTATEPFQERTEINGETVSVTREGQKPRRFSLRRAPELRSMLSGFGALLGGSRTALEQDFNIALQGESVRWKLTLVPKATRVGRHVRDIVINGADTEPRCLVVTEPDEDVSFMLVGAAAQVALPNALEPAWLSHHCENAGD